VYNLELCWSSPVHSFLDPSPLELSTIFYCLSQHQSHTATGGKSISKSWCRAPSGAHDQIFITLWQLQCCFCGVPSLTRERICLLYMLLVLASLVFLGSEFLGTRDLRLPFSSPPTTRRVMVEVFDPPPHGSTLSDSRLLFLFPPTTHRATVKVFDPPPHGNRIY
jgi:hypothetical protein